MNNKEFIAELSRRSGLTQEAAQKYVRQVIDTMACAFDNGESVLMPAFGTFEVKKRMERVIVNPSTGQRMMVPPKIVLGFKPVPSIKQKLKNGGTADE